MEKFTKGLWEAKTDKLGGMEMGMVYIQGGGFDVSGAPDAIANANLIACAPKMYEILKKCKAEILDLDETVFDERGTGKRYEPEIVTDIDKILTKARGEHESV